MLTALRSIILLLFTCFFSTAFSQSVSHDSLLSFIKLNNKDFREQKIVGYIKASIQDLPLKGLNQKKGSIVRSITGSNIENKQALILLTEAIYQKRLLNFEEAKKKLSKAIGQVQKDSDHFLLYTFFTYLAFTQTDEGNVIDAVYSYTLAKNEVQKLNNPFLETLLCINISDIYYRSGLYSQSLVCLDDAMDLYTRRNMNQVNVLRLIYYNKAENYFRTGNYDSLNVYHKKLSRLKNDIYQLYTSQKRTGYYLLLLKHNYKTAIPVINTLVKDSLFIKVDIDEQYLASAYFNNGQIDSAKYIINNLLSRPSLVNHPEIKVHLYEMLGEIAGIKNDNKLAVYNLKLALQQSKQNINNLTQVGNISSNMKINDVQNLYNQNMLTYKKDQLRLRFIVALAFLIVVIVTIFYRSNRQKRHYEKLLYAAKKHELATINSHEVRNHLSNILGLLDLMNDEDNKGSELLKTKDYLQYSAEQLDKALKNVSQKLSD
ncbi:hypothetical protein SNE25_25010 [Mucilaginibacter sabulilitoris]|uniref:histidine kinase n=1 Tax=Mucilaginibacter sabulilitoris TaxID=1173583 RepID=A0ABZ0TK77_9SPHI|nr:hypothetical protein [Mucilaginibacter sabulilitoris]WPU92588.1 hypothetical protein SNE25_25010 [Mucilaginibacter sabulilitoris]